jgi:hypothetical protein
LRQEGSSEVLWDDVGLKEGDRIVGTVHTHPGGAGAEHFSLGDVDYGKSLRSQLLPQEGAIYPGVGVHLYVVQPGATGGILDFNVARNVITTLP